MKKMKKYIILLVTGVFVASMLFAGIGCNNETTEGAAEETAGGTAENITLTFWVAFADVYEYIEWVGEKYHKENPNITIEAILFPQRALDEKVSATLPAGEGGDIIFGELFSLKPYAEAGYVNFVPDDFVLWAEDNFPSEVIEITKLEDNGESFIIPCILNTMGTYYNKDHFDEAGLTSPPETMEEQMEYAKKLTKYDDDGNITRVGLDLRLGGGGWGIADKFQNQAMIPYGVKFVEGTDGKWKAAYNNEQGVEAVSYYLDAVHKYKVEGLETKSDAEAFGLGVSSMFERESWVVGYLKNNAPEINYGTSFMPKGPGGWGNLIVTSGTIVSENSSYKKEAWDFIKYFVNDENAVELVSQTGWQASRINVDYSDAYKENPEIQTFIDSLTTPGYGLVTYDVIPNNVEFRTKFGEMLLEILKNPKFLDDSEAILKALDEMAIETNRMFDDYGVLAE